MLQNLPSTRNLDPGVWSWLWILAAYSPYLRAMTLQSGEASSLEHILWYLYAHDVLLFLEVLQSTNNSCNAFAFIGLWPCHHLHFKIQSLLNLTGTQTGIWYSHYVMNQLKSGTLNEATEWGHSITPSLQLLVTMPIDHDRVGGGIWGSGEVAAEAEGWWLMTLATYNNGSILSCFSLTCNLHLCKIPWYVQPPGKMQSFQRDHVSSVGPMPVYLLSTTLTLKECQYLLACLQTVNNNWWLLALTSDVVCRHSSTVNIDFRTTYVLANQLFSLLLAGSCYLTVIYWAFAETRNPSLLTGQGTTLQIVYWGASNSIASPCAMAEKATTGQYEADL